MLVYVWGASSHLKGDLSWLPEQLVTKAIHAKIPHGVSVEGTIVGMELIFPPLRERFVHWVKKIISRIWKRPVASPQAILPMVKFCSIRRIDFVDSFQKSDGEELKRGAAVYINDFDSIVAEAFGRGYFSRSKPFNARASFYANGALTVKFISLAKH